MTSMVNRITVVSGKDGKVFIWASDSDNNLTYYHFQDDLKFHHTVSLFRAIPTLQMVNVASARPVSKKSKPDNVLEEMREILSSNVGNVLDEDGEAPPETPIRSHGVISPKTNMQQLHTTLKSILSSDAAFLQFSGQIVFQQEPTLSAALVLHLEACNDISNCPSIGPGTLLSSFLHIDATAAEAIHLWPPANAAQQYQTGGHNSTNSLYGLLSSSCVTSSGKVLLKKWLRQPLVSLSSINDRQDAVEYWLDNSIARQAVRTDGLRPFNTDLSKLGQKLTSGSIQTRTFLEALYEMYLVCHQKLPILVEQLESSPEERPSLVDGIVATLRECTAQLQPAAELAEAVLDLDQAPREYLVQPEFKDELQDVAEELKQCQEQIRSCHADMNAEWSSWTGDDDRDAVRLEETNEGGLQFRLTKTNHSKVLQQQSSITVHRLLKNGVYFSNKQIRELATQRQKLRDEYDKLSEEVVKDAMEPAATHAPTLIRAANSIQRLDVLIALAHTAAHRQYCRPELSDDATAAAPRLELIGARHACVELQDSVEFIPNDCLLGDKEPSFMLVTGPNSKSMLSVPCLVLIVVGQWEGKVHTCDQSDLSLSLPRLDPLFRAHQRRSTSATRVGAGDWQERGISTFMAEMLESSRILSSATRRSLILIDELGRGTSTYDGYGLASAISDHIIHKIGCLCIFTTHFHELTSMKNIKNCHVTAQTNNGVLTFLYSVRPGPCLESFGIAVAEMANIPSAVIEDARRRAKRLEGGGVLEKFRRLPKETMLQLKDNPDRNNVLLQLLSSSN